MAMVKRKTAAVREVIGKAVKRKDSEFRLVSEPVGFLHVKTKTICFEKGVRIVFAE